MFYRPRWTDERNQLAWLNGEADIVEGVAALGVTVSAESSLS